MNGSERDHRLPWQRGGCWRQSRGALALATFAFAPLSSSLSLTGCGNDDPAPSAGAGGATAEVARDKCHDLLDFYCSRSVDCLLELGTIDPEQAERVRSYCETSGVIAYENGGLLTSVLWAFVRQHPADYYGTPTDCDAALDVSPNYGACLNTIRDATCSEYGLSTTNVERCSKVIEVAEEP